MLEIDVYDLEGKIVGKAQLPEELFGQAPSEAILHEVVRAYLAGQRSGSASTKRRSEVRGSGRKLWRQKGTGRARVGDARSSIRRGGGSTFGPKPRDYRIKLSTKIKRKGLIFALSDAAAQDNIVFLDSFNLDEPKTSKMMAILNKLGIKDALIIVDKQDPTIVLASRNIPDVEVAKAINLNAYQVLKYDKLIITKEGLNSLKERFSKSA